MSGPLAQRDDSWKRETNPFKDRSLVERTSENVVQAPATRSPSRCSADTHELLDLLDPSLPYEQSVWVTVIGRQPEFALYVCKALLQYGKIQGFALPPRMEGNFIHVQFTAPIAAQHAVQTARAKFFLIGEEISLLTVLPCTDYEYAAANRRGLGKGSSVCEYKEIAPIAFRVTWMYYVRKALCFFLFLLIALCVRLFGVVKKLASTAMQRLPREGIWRTCAPVIKQGLVGLGRQSVCAAKSVIVCCWARISMQRVKTAMLAIMSLRWGSFSEYITSGFHCGVLSIQNMVLSVSIFWLSALKGKVTSLLNSTSSVFYNCAAKAQVSRIAVRSAVGCFASATKEKACKAVSWLLSGVSKAKGAIFSISIANPMQISFLFVKNTLFRVKTGMSYCVSAPIGFLSNLCKVTRTKISRLSSSLATWWSAAIERSQMYFSKAKTILPTIDIQGVIFSLASTIKAGVLRIARIISSVPQKLILIWRNCFTICKDATTNFGFSKMGRLSAKAKEMLANMRISNLILFVPKVSFVISAKARLSAFSNMRSYLHMPHFLSRVKKPNTPASQSSPSSSPLRKEHLTRSRDKTPGESASL